MSGLERKLSKNATRLMWGRVARKEIPYPTPHVHASATKKPRPYTNDPLGRAILDRQQSEKANGEKDKGVEGAPSAPAPTQ